MATGEVGDKVLSSPSPSPSPSPPPGLSASLAQRAESLFSLLDTGGCGYLSQADLARCCGDEINVADVFAQLDTDGDGRIDAADFQSAIGLLLTAGAATSTETGEEQRELEAQLCSKSFSQEDGLNAEPPTSPSLFDVDDEGVGQLTCRDQVSELHRQLGRQCPQLLDTFEQVMASVAKDVTVQARERRQLEASYQRARAENERHVRQMEEEAEAQMARMELLARERERRRLEEEYQELLRTKEREVGQLRQMMELMQAETAKSRGAEQDIRRKRQQRHRRRKPDGGLADDDVEADAGGDIDAEGQADAIQTGGASRLMADMRQLETALALSSSEVARLRQDRDDGERELQLERSRLREHQREQERLTRQLQLLHDANRSLNDTNDSLRAALERQRSVASSIASVSASTSAAALSVLDLSQPHEAVLPAFDTCEEDDDPDYLLDAAAAAEADSGTSTFRDQPAMDSSGGSGRAAAATGAGFRLSHLSGLSGWEGDSDISASEVDSHEADSGSAEKLAATAKRPNSLALNLPRRRLRRRRFGGEASNGDDTDEGGDSSSDGAAMQSPHLSSDPDFTSVDQIDGELPLSPLSSTPPTPSPLGPPERMFRIVMAGDAAVGKTCFITRFCEGRFDSGAVSTLGVDFKTRTVKVDGHVIAVQLWDTAGQERFRSIAKSYFRRADGVILVYDCTSDRSFVSVRDWVESIRDSCVAADDESGAVPIMIVANKTDLREAARQRSGAAQRVIETEEGRRLAELFSAALFVEASARSGDNVSSSVMNLCRLLQQREDLAVSRAAADAALELHTDEKTAKKRLPACCS